MGGMFSGPPPIPAAPPPPPAPLPPPPEVSAAPKIEDRQESAPEQAPDTGDKRRRARNKASSLNSLETSTESESILGK